MQDSPNAAQLLSAVVAYLRQDAGPALAAAGQSALAYQARVAANMLEIARREITLAPASDAAEQARLQALLPDEAALPGADLVRLNQALAERIAQGDLGLHTPGLAEHLWQTTLDKLAVDQPKYASYQQALATRGKR